MKMENAKKTIHFDLSERSYRMTLEKLKEGPTYLMLKAKDEMEKNRHQMWRLRIYGYISLMAQFMCATYICFALRTRRFALTALSNQLLRMCFALVIRKLLMSDF